MVNLIFCLYTFFQSIHSLHQTFLSLNLQENFRRGGRRGGGGTFWDSMDVVELKKLMTFRIAVQTVRCDGQRGHMFCCKTTRPITIWLHIRIHQSSITTPTYYLSLKCFQKRKVPAAPYTLWWFWYMILFVLVCHLFWLFLFFNIIITTFSLICFFILHGQMHFQCGPLWSLLHL